VALPEPPLPDLPVALPEPPLPDPPVALPEPPLPDPEGAVDGSWLADGPIDGSWLADGPIDGSAEGGSGVGQRGTGETEGMVGIADMQLLTAGRDPPEHSEEVSQAHPISPAKVEK